MTRGKQTTALALAGAFALASGAYALGTQADDGNAAAAKSPNAAPAFAGGPGRPGFGHHGGPGGPAFDSLADRLGVSEAKLRTALEDIAKEHRTDFAQTLADALSIDRAKVRAALQKHRNHPTSPEQLAKELGVSEEKLHDAFHAVMRKIRPRGPGRPGLDNLANALGVTRAQLEAAFDKLRADHDRLRDQFAEELAKRLGLDPSKVQDALEESRPFGPRRRP